MNDLCKHRRIWVDWGSVHSLQNESNVNPLHRQRLRCREYMKTAIFIITSKNKAPQSLNRRHLVFPCSGVETTYDSSLGEGSKVRRPCQSTIVGAVCAELPHSDRNLRTA